MPVHSQTDIEIVVFCTIWRGLIAFERACAVDMPEDVVMLGILLLKVSFGHTFCFKLPVILVQQRKLFWFVGFSFVVWFLFLVFNFNFSMLCFLKIYSRHLSLAITSQPQFAKKFNTGSLVPATCQEFFAMQLVKHYLTDWAKPSSFSLWFLSW